MTAMPLTFEISDQRKPEDMRRIDEGLDAHTLQSAGAEWRSVSFLARDSGGVLRGGLITSKVGNSFFLHLLWVDESLRGQGLGRQLMGKVEEEAARQHCTQLNVDTFDYQAPEFYQKLGYETTAVIPDYFDSHSRIFLRKKLQTTGVN